VWDEAAWWDVDERIFLLHTPLDTSHIVVFVYGGTSEGKVEERKVFVLCIHFLSSFFLQIRTWRHTIYILKRNGARVEVMSQNCGKFYEVLLKYIVKVRFK
jgi:hypothetical protein